MSMYDILIIGGGPIGLACGIAAKNAGLNYIIIEKGTVVNSLYNYPVNMTFFSTSERLEIGNVPFMSLLPKPKRAEAVEYYRRVLQLFQLNIHLFENAEDVKRNEAGFFTIKTTKAVYEANNIVVATGFYDIPVKLNIAGEDLPKVSHYYNDPHFYSFQKVIVVGASNSSVDAALECWRKGAEVTMVIRKEDIGQTVKYWVRPDILNRISEGSIKAYFSSSLTAVRQTEAEIQTPEGKVTVANDFVLALTGYHPDFTLLNKLGIQMSADEARCPYYHEDTMQTNQPGIYLAGVVCGGMNTHKLFIENSREHAGKIINDIAAKIKAAK